MGNKKVRFFRVADVPDVELYHTNGVSRSVPRHVHSVFSASVTLSGYRIHETRQAKHIVQTGDILVVNIDEMHSSLPGDVESSTLAIRLLPRFMTQMTREITGRQDESLPFRQPVIQDGELARQMLAMQAALADGCSRLAKEERILDVFYQLYSRHSAEPAFARRLGQEKMPIARACEYLRDCTEENVSLERLAAVAGLSPFHFSRVFAKEVGVSPHIYQLQIRLQKATELLAAGCSLAEVAVATGFCDQSHLQKLFKKKYGITPGQYGR
jgi:transcriptional regulator GlxA family with amidase domain